MASGRIGFIGSGRMATAIIRGWNAAGTVPMSSIAVAAPSSRCTGPLKAEIPEITVAESNVDVVQRSTIVILAVKPHILPAALQSIKRRITPAHLVVTIAAGVTTAQVEGMLGKSVRVVRVVPNTPCAVRCNAGALCKGRKASDADTKRVQKLFASLSADGSEPDALDEKLMDAVTGVAGSGPAFVFSFIESLADGGVYSGLPRHVAARLAAQTVLGAAKLVLESGEHPAALRDAVCSPGGTTIEGIRALEEGGLRATVIGAVAAASTKGAVLREQAEAAAAEAAQAAAAADEDLASSGEGPRAASAVRAGSVTSSTPEQAGASGFSAPATSAGAGGARAATAATAFTVTAAPATPGYVSAPVSSMSSPSAASSIAASNVSMGVPSASMSPSISLGIDSRQLHPLAATDATSLTMVPASGAVGSGSTRPLDGSVGTFSSPALPTGPAASPPPTVSAVPSSDPALHLAAAPGSADPLAGLAPAPPSSGPASATQMQPVVSSDMAEMLASTLPGAALR